MIRPALGLLFGILVVGGTPGAPLGLLDQAQTFPWSVGLAPVVQEEAGGLVPGEFRLRSSELWFNTYRQYTVDGDLDQVVDMEGGITTVSVAYSPTPGWELRGQVQGWVLGGGVMDPSLAAFHGVVGVPNQGRQSSGNNRYRVFVAGVYDDRQAASGLTQASVGARWFAGPWSATWWVKPPVPGHVGWAWSDRWGGGWAAGWGDRWPVPAWGLQLRAGATAGVIGAQPDDALGPTQPWTVQFGGYGIVEWFAGPRFVTQASWTRVPRTATGYLPMAAGLLTLGLQWPLADRWVLEAGVTEEFLTWATMEVGFQAGVSWTHG